MPITIFRMISILLLFSIALTGCSSASKSPEVKTKEIVAVTIAPEKAFVQAVGGDFVEVIVLVPPGNSPGNYEPTPMEMEQFAKASLYFTIGVATEQANILPKAEESESLRIVSLQKEAATVYPEREMSPGNRDPHIWLSPRRVRVMIDVIERELSVLDPKNKDAFHSNAEVYRKALDTLDKEMTDTLKNVKSRQFIVFHPAFGYLADDYGLVMHALEEDGKEATPTRLAEMVDLAKKENIRAVFHQAEISSAQAIAFAEEIDGKTILLEPLSPDYIANLRGMAQLMAEVMK